MPAGTASCLSSLTIPAAVLLVAVHGGSPCSVRICPAGFRSVTGGDTAPTHTPAAGEPLMRPIARPGGCAVLATLIPTAAGKEESRSGLSFLIFLGFERAAFLRHTDFHARCAFWLRRGGVRVLPVVGNRHFRCRGHGARSSLTRCNSSGDVVTMSWTHVTAQARRTAARPSWEWVITEVDDDLGVPCLVPAAQSAVWRSSRQEPAATPRRAVLPTGRAFIKGCAVDESLGTR
jgi:hypothetical protein